jgi:glycosyltransferase involved in cell wall biosynthesis
MATPRISVIIPCYNHGLYLQDAIDSVEASSFKDYEIIIVNDGSTDAFTIKQKDELSQRGYHVIDQPNQGVSKARNNGISAALGQYIMPLDADNKIRPTYIEKAVAILDCQPEIGVVYAKAANFGEVEMSNHIGNIFDSVELFLNNYIDNLSVFRKSVWARVGGYDENMLEGLEDWDFWMTLYENEVGYYFIDEILFDYRVLSDSHSSKADNNYKVFSYMSVKHANTYRKKFEYVARELKDVNWELKNARSRPLRFFFRHQFYGLYKIYERIENSVKKLKKTMSSFLLNRSSRTIGRSEK